MVTDENNCSSTGDVIVTLNDLPISDAGSTVSICLNEETILDASVSTGTGDLVYLWSPATGLSDVNSVNPVASPLNTTTYTVAVTDANSCTSSSDVEVIVNELPITTFIDDLEGCDDDDDGLTQFDLESQTAQILGSQDPTQFIVSYYNSLSDALDNTNTLIIN